MRQLWVRPAIYRYESAIDFVKDFHIGREDLIIANRAVFSPHFGELLSGPAIFFLEDYGSGEGDFATFEAIRAAMKSGGKKWRRVFAVGGGTALELAKLLSLGNFRSLADLFAGRVSARRRRELVLVPTTCGTGSEVTSLAVLKSPDTGDRLWLKSDALFADAAVLIPQLLEGLPFRTFSAGAVDALAKAAESFVSPLASSHTRIFARAATEKILRGFRDIVINGEMARFPLLHSFMTAANYAGISFGNAGGGAVHALAAPLVDHLRVAPGEAKSMVFAAVFGQYRELKGGAALERFERILARALGCEEKNAYAELASLLDRILPGKALRERPLANRDLELFTAGVMTRQGRFMANSPVIMEAGDILSIYKTVFRRSPLEARARPAAEGV